MAEHSKIEWTQATWNPLVGCTIHSAGCTHCYAMKDAWRLMHNPNAKVAAKFAGTARVVNGHPVWTGRINLDEVALLAPLRRRAPTTYFVNSMSDLFHEDVADETIDRVFAAMALCPQHIFQVLTKRSARMRAYLTTFEDRPDAFGEALARVVRAAGFEKQRGIDTIDAMNWPLPNVWLGVSVEDQRAADERVPDLCATPAALRFLSCEPLIGPVDLASIAFDDDDGDEVHLNALTGSGILYENEDIYALPLDVRDGYFSQIHWVIAGGESGHGARPMHPDWARGLRDQCAAAGVPFFFKQWGSCLPGNMDGEDEYGGPAYEIEDVAQPVDYDVLGRGKWLAAHGAEFIRFGHKRCGRSLDGVEHNRMPA